MSVSHSQKSQELKNIDLHTLPPYRFNEKANVAIQIAAHLQKTLDLFGVGSPVILRIPSVMDLSCFYHQSVLDVLDGLFALKAQHYEYMMNGLDDVVTLEDPLARTKSNQIFPAAWHALSRERRSPWDLVQDDSIPIKHGKTV